MEIISNLNSLIINNNYEYNRLLKSWINPNKKIEAELLYRLSRDGETTSKFHELCDNKGPTLTLFYINNGNIVGIYTPLSFDINSSWKRDNDTFIFNLNKNQKYKKKIIDNSIYCNESFGPFTYWFGTDGSETIKKIIYNNESLEIYYEKGSDFLPKNNSYYNLDEAEVYKIKI